MASVSQLERTRQYIRRKLSLGEFALAQPMSRRLLATEIGVSSALVQQALLQLEAEGLIESRPQRGTYPRMLTAGEYAELCDVRELIEPYAAARAAAQITPAGVDELQQCCDRFVAACRQYQEGRRTAPRRRVLLAKLNAEEQRFHSAIVEAARNRILSEIMGRLRLLEVMAAVTVEWDDEQLASRTAVARTEHQEIVDALRAHDAELARRRMQIHIQGSRLSIPQES